MLRVKEMHDKIVAQADDLATWNRTLEKRVADQLGQIERVSRLKRFLAPQVAELIVAESNEQILESHRREITVVFGDLRGFTGFAETAEPEEVITVLRDYHTNLGPLVHKYAGTLERFLGDGFLILFNDPLPCADPSIQAVKMAIEMRDRFAVLEPGHRSVEIPTTGTRSVADDTLREARFDVPVAGRNGSSMRMSSRARRSPSRSVGCEIRDWAEARRADTQLLSEWRVYRMFDTRRGAVVDVQFLVRDRLLDGGAYATERSRIKKKKKKKKKFSDSFPFRPIFISIYLYTIIIGIS